MENTYTKLLKLVFYLIFIWQLSLNKSPLLQKINNVFYRPNMPINWKLRRKELPLLKF